MIAENGEYTILSLELTQFLEMRIEVCRLDVQQIACEHDHIRLLGIDAVDGIIEYIGVALLVAAHVGIREDHDAIAVESLRKCFGFIFNVVHLKLIEPRECSPEHNKPDDRNRQHTNEVAVVLTGLLLLLDAIFPNE